jgi:hypothetical protein
MGHHVYHWIHEVLETFGLDNHLSQHVVACAVITCVAFIVFRRFQTALVFAVACAVIASLGKEIGDWLEWWPWCEHRHCEWDDQDLLADAVGIALALGLMLLVSTICFSTPSVVYEEREPLRSV